MIISRRSKLIAITAASVARSVSVAVTEATEDWDAEMRAEVVIAIIGILASLMAGCSPDYQASLEEVIDRIRSVPRVDHEMLGLKRVEEEVMPKAKA